MGFYPHGKPSWYSYTERFTEVGHDTIGAAYAHTRYPGLDEKEGQEAVIDKALANLEAIIEGARAAEMAFLADTGIDLADSTAAGDIFCNMNLILNSKDTFERGLQYMRNIADAGTNMEKNQMYRDVSRFFSTYLNREINKRITKAFTKKLWTITEDELEKKVNGIITGALVETYKRVKDFVRSDGQIRTKFGQSKANKKLGEQEVQAVTDMIEVIKELGDNDAFKKFGYLFDLDAKSLLERKGYKIGKIKKNYTGAEVDSRYGGNALELVTSVLTRELAAMNINISSPDNVLHIESKHTGQANQMKADSLLFFTGSADVYIPDYLEFVDTGISDSVRVQNVDALSRYLDVLRDNVKHVVAISDKNYSITADFSGVTAQEKMNLQNAGTLLSQFGVGDVDRLIDYLANCGAGMVQGTSVAGEIRTALQSYIAYFLFDHLQINVQASAPSVNVVNVLNVSGLYIPLSVYLEGVYNSIKGALGNPTSFVSVSLSLGGPTAGSVWTAETWDAFREGRETQSFISYKILKDIASFISSL